MTLDAIKWSIYLQAPKGVDDSAIRTLQILADHSNGEYMAWPSWETLQTERGASRATIARHIKTLFEAGLILPGDERYVQHLPRNRRPKVWFMNVDVEVIPRGLKRETPSGTRGLTQRGLGVSSGETQSTHRSNNSSYVLNPRDRETPWDNLPGVECDHGYDCVTITIKRTGQQIPKCAECRRAGHYVVSNEPLLPVV